METIEYPPIAIVMLRDGTAVTLTEAEVCHASFRSGWYAGKMGWSRSCFRKPKEIGWCAARNMRLPSGFTSEEAVHEAFIPRPRMPRDAERIMSREDIVLLRRKLEKKIQHYRTELEKAERQLVELPRHCPCGRRKSCDACRA